MYYSIVTYIAIYILTLRTYFTYNAVYIDIAIAIGSKYSYSYSYSYVDVDAVYSIDMLYTST